MANEARTPGKHGWKPRNPEQRVPYLEDHLLAGLAGGALPAPLPAASGDIDRETRVSDWHMYVNGPDPDNPPYAPDGLGDCTIAGPAHSFTAMSVYAGFPAPFFTTGAIVGAYSAVGGYVLGDPNTDNGADMVTVCKYMQATGLRDVTGKVHKYYAWAAFRDPANTALQAQVLNAGGTVVLASGIQQSQEDQFSAGEPWQWVLGEGVAGGHCYVLQRRRVGGIGIRELVTWGAVQRSTLQFWHYACQQGQAEAYFVASEDFVTANGTTVLGMSLDQLAADCADVE